MPKSIVALEETGTGNRTQEPSFVIPLVAGSSPARPTSAAIFQDHRIFSHRFAASKTSTWADGRGARHTAKRGFQRKAAVRTGECSRKFCIERGRDELAIVNGDQVDVLTEPPGRQMRAGQRGAADELDAVSDAVAEQAEHVRDEVIAFDLLNGDAESRCHRVSFIDVHVGAQASARRRDAVRR